MAVLERLADPQIRQYLWSLLAPFGLLPLLSPTLLLAVPSLAINVLSDNTPMLTAYANDVSYDDVFAAPLEALSEPGDVAFALSGSGNSTNVLRAMEVARARGLTRIGLTGRDGKIPETLELI